MSAEQTLSHRGPDGLPRMVDVSRKDVTMRVAVASGVVRCSPSTAALIAGGEVPKGDVLTTARIAGILAAKRTGELIPMCHPLGLDHIAVELVVDQSIPGVSITATVTCTGRTGVEMEALTAVTVAGLTVIDMAKSADPWMTFDQVGVQSKSGGRSGTVSRPTTLGDQPPRP